MSHPAYPASVSHADAYFYQPDEDDVTVEHDPYDTPDCDPYDREDGE